MHCCTGAGNTVPNRADIDARLAFIRYCSCAVLQVLRHWREELAAVPARTLLERHGVRGLLAAGATLCGKLAGVSYARSAHLQREAALLGAHLIAAAFAGSVTHPQRAVDFASYTPAALSEGASELFCDARELDAAEVASGAQAVAAALLRGGAPLEALPVVALWEWMARDVARDAAMTVRARLARARALTDLGLLQDAYSVVTRLMTGVGLPDALGGGPLVLHLPDGAPYNPVPIPHFLANERPGAPANKAALEFLAQGGMHVAVSTQLGPWAVAQVALARCRVLHALGRVPHAWSHLDPRDGAPMREGAQQPDKVRMCTCLSPGIAMPRPMSATMLHTWGES